MKLLSSTRNKIILLLLITLLVFTGWQAGLETVYAKLVVSTTNYTLDVIKDDTRIEYKRKSMNL